MSVTAAIGKAGHKAVEMFLKGSSEADSIAVGLEYLNKLSNFQIDFGKTGSREQMLKTYNQAINFYFEEFVPPYEILGIEESITVEVTRLDGSKFPVPVKAVSDVVARNKLGELEVIDHKFVKSYTDGGVDDFTKWIQSMFNYHTVKEKYREAPARMIFSECKTSKNKDGSPQIQDYVFNFNSQIFNTHVAAFYALFDGVVKNIHNPDFQFLPNPNDMFSGQATFDVFMHGILGIEAPEAISQKTEIRDFVEKKFIQSNLDKVENINLTNEEKIRIKFQEFGIPVEMKETHIGASIVQYTLKPARGVQMSRFKTLRDDIAQALECKSVRVEAPIKGTGLVGIEIPNINRKTIKFGENHLNKGTFLLPIGVDVFGEVHYKDITKMPHLLVAGQTGSGKSVMLNVILETLTRQLTSEQMKLVLIDPKQVELTMFEDSEHLYQPVVTDTVRAAETLDKLVNLMESRYEKLKELKVRSIDDYKGNDMPRIITIIDEFADLMMMADNKKHTFELNSKELVESIIEANRYDVNISSIDLNLVKRRVTAKTDPDLAEEITKNKEAFKYLQDMILSAAESSVPPAEHSIVRLAQKARAVGIHLILATQRPSKEVVTGLIKANIPAKIAFTASNSINSRIILDESGAESLTGKGDLLYSDPSESELQRLQGLYA